MYKENMRLKYVVMIAVIVIGIVISLFITLDEYGVISMGLPSWDEVYSAAGLRDTDESDANLVCVECIDVGQGDSIFIKTPSGCVLIDAGENGCGETVTQAIKNYGTTKIDYVIATHPHSDHIGGLDEVLPEFEVANVIMPKLTKSNTPTTKSYEDFLDAVDETSANVIAAKPGAQYELGKAVLTVLAPIEQSDDLNDMSVVAQLSYGLTSFLFTGDAGKSVEKQIINSEYAQYIEDINVLKAGHHGSSTSSSTSFLKKVSPEYILISCGVDNDYGHPHDEAMTRFEKTRAAILRTDTMGSIVMYSDGEKVTQGK